MLLGFTNPDNDTNDFHQRVADQNIQSLEDRQEEIRHAKNGFIGMLAGIVVGEYAVSSGWFNPEALLYMAVVTVGTYGQTNFEMGYAFKFLRVLMLILTQIFNLAGFITGVVISVLMIAFNRTITGKSYIYPLIPWDGKMLKRKVFRVRLPHGFK